MFNLLDLSGLSTNKEVTEAITKRVKEIDINYLIEELAKDFVHHEKATKKIYAALATGNNAILYGPGGYGKSVLVKKILNFYKIPVTYKVGYSGMTSEELFGLPNIKKLLDESKYETAFENSIFNNAGIIIFEEMFDADPEVVSSLKDILTEKGLREFDRFKESLASSVIVIGNKSPEEASIDDSTSAFFLERFPYRHKVIWPSFNFEDYLNYFQVYFEPEQFQNNIDLLKTTSKICALNPIKISPRVAAQAAETVMNLGLEFIDTVTNINCDIVREQIILHNINEEIREEENFLDSCEYIFNNILEENKNNFMKYCKLQIFQENFLSDVKITDYNVISLKGLNKSVEKALFDLKEDFEKEFINEIRQLQNTKQR